MWWLVSTAAAMDLSYDDALRRALEKNPALVAEQYDLESAQGQLMGSKGIFDPVFAGQALYGHGMIFDDTSQFAIEGDQAQYEASLYQLFPTGTQAALKWQLDREDPDNPIFDSLGYGPWSSELGLSIVQPLLQGILPYYNTAGDPHAE